MIPQKETVARLNILAFIKRFIQENSYPPTYREIQAQLGISSLSLLTYHLDRLEDSGYIERKKNSPRSIRILEKK